VGRGGAHKQLNQPLVAHRPYHPALQEPAAGRVDRPAFRLPGRLGDLRQPTDRVRFTHRERHQQGPDPAAAGLRLGGPADRRRRRDMQDQAGPQLPARRQQRHNEAAAIELGGHGNLALLGQSSHEDTANPAGVVERTNGPIRPPSDDVRLVRPLVGDNGRERTTVMGNLTGMAVRGDAVHVSNEVALRTPDCRWLRRRLWATEAPGSRRPKGLD
jgi:hypothetical protein